MTAKSAQARVLTAPVHGGDDAELVGQPLLADFSTSVNAYGPAPRLVDAIRDALDPRAIASYPDPRSTRARGTLAQHLGIASSQFATGAGATDLILAIVTAFTNPGDRVVVPRHAFSEYARTAALVGAHVVTTASNAVSTAPIVRPDRTRELLCDAIAGHRPSLAFVCTPDSPFGETWSIDDLEALVACCERHDCMLVVDLSFDGFLERPLGIPTSARGANSIALRSLTKDFALAGIRAAYCVSSTTNIERIERARIPWTVTAPMEAAIVATCDASVAAHATATTALLRAHAREMRASLERSGFATSPTHTHYFTVEVDDAAETARALRAAGLRVRDCTSFGLPRHIRVAARTPDENRLLTDVMTTASLGRS